MKNRLIIMHEVMAQLRSGKRLRQRDWLAKTWRLAAYIYEIQRRFKWHVSRRVINKRGAVEYYLSLKELTRLPCG